MQTAVRTTMRAGIPGQLADEWTERNGARDTFTSEEASAAIPFGVFLKKGTGDTQAKLLSATSDILVGVVVWEADFARPYHQTDAGLLPGVTFTCLTKGKIWVVPETNVTAYTSEVHVRAVATGNEVKGAIRATADSTDTIDITGFARWITSASAGEPAILEIDMANGSFAVAD